jgi:hypothetical protein
MLLGTCHGCQRIKLPAIAAMHALRPFWVISVIAISRQRRPMSAVPPRATVLGLGLKGREVPIATDAPQHDQCKKKGRLAAVSPKYDQVFFQVARAGSATTIIFRTRPCRLNASCALSCRYSNDERLCDESISCK